MKYAIRYYRGGLGMKYADELIIEYKNTSDYLPEFAEKHNDTRIIVNATVFEEEDWADSIRYFMEASEKNDISIMISLDNQGYIIQSLRDAGVKFFFIEGADTLDKMWKFINYGVSDIYIINDLCFSLKQVSSICHDRDIKIRVFPNVAQKATDDEDSFTSFFIRPEDLAIYDLYIDVFEFFGPDNRQGVLCEIYKSMQWYGQLSELIIGLNTDARSDCFPPHWGHCRSMCGRRCKIRENSCKVCEAAYDLAKTLEKENVSIQIKQPQKIIEKDPLETDN